MPELTVAAGLAKGLMELAVAKGASQEALAERSGIDPAQLADQDQRIPFEKYVALMRAGKELTGDPALALHYGETSEMSEFSVVGLLANAAETMLDAFVQLNRYGQLVIETDQDGDRFELVRRDGQLWGVDRRRNPNDFYELTESTFARMACGPRRFTDVQFLKELHVTHPAPSYSDEYDRIFRCPVVFGSEWNAFALDEQWASFRVALQPRYVFGILSEHADALLESLQRSKSMRGRVESLLMPVLHTGEKSMDSVAAKLGVSRQTLFRRLKAEGTSFEQVLDDLRRQLALHYLSGGKVSVHEAAYLVGFSDPAAFSRAFKRWTGKSPREMRGKGHDSRDGMA